MAGYTIEIKAYNAAGASLFIVPDTDGVMSTTVDSVKAAFHFMRTTKSAFRWDFETERFVRNRIARFSIVFSDTPNHSENFERPSGDNPGTLPEPATRPHLPIAPKPSEEDVTSHLAADSALVRSLPLSARSGKQAPGASAESPVCDAVTGEEVMPGMLIEATIASNSPTPRDMRIRVDRKPWPINARSTTVSDGRGVDAVYTDSIRIIREDEPETVTLTVQARHLQNGDRFEHHGRTWSVRPPVGYLVSTETMEIYCNEGMVYIPSQYELTVTRAASAHREGEPRVSAGVDHRNT